MEEYAVWIGKEALRSDVRHDKVQDDGINSDGITALPTVILFWNSLIEIKFSEGLGLSTCSEESTQFVHILRVGFALWKY